MKALVVIDMQNDFIRGTLGSPEAEAIVPKVREKILAHDGPLFFTKDIHHSDYYDHWESRAVPAHCIAGTQGADITEDLMDLVPLGVVLTKEQYGYDDWNNFELYRILSDANEIEVCGLCTDICVISNVLILRALYPEHNIIVDAGCCAGSSKEAHDAAIRVMKSCNITIKE